jgi:hypothetical protein
MDPKPEVTRRDLGRYSWICETGTDHPVAHLHDSLMMMMIIVFLLPVLTNLVVFLREVHYKRWI